MDRRGLFLLLSTLAVSGCASVKSFVAAMPSEPAVEVPRMTPAQAYDSGLMNVARGDYDAARRDWNRCLAMTTADNPARMDCLVALERLASPDSLNP